MAKTIDDYKKDYAAARAKGDAAGMQAANDGANAIRKSQGVAEQKATADIAKVANQNKSTGGVRLSGTSGSGGTKTSTTTPSAQQILSAGKGPLSQSGYNKAVSGTAGGGLTLKPASGASGGSGSSAGGSGAWATGKDDYGDTDYSVLLKRAISAGASAAEVQSLLDKRVQKAEEKGYSQYAYDDVYENAQRYIASKSGQTPPVQAEAGQTVQTGKDYDLTEYLRKQKAAEVESALAGLKEAYTKGMADYDATLDKLPARYQAARNSAAVQSAMEKQAFDERAAASGLNSGASGQAALDASAVYQGNLSQLHQSQAQEAAEIDRAKAALKAQYETAIAQARADGNADLAQALYQELIRGQGLAREDADKAYDRYRDALADQERKEAETKAEAEAKASQEYERKLQAAALMAQVGNFSGYADLWGLDQGQVDALVADYAQQKQTTKEAAARELADWYAQYGDLSKLTALGVDTSALEAQYAQAVQGGTRSGSGLKGGGGLVQGQNDDPDGTDDPVLGLVAGIKQALANGLTLPWRGAGAPQAVSSYRDLYRAVDNYIKNGLSDDDAKWLMDQIDQARSTGGITEAQYQELGRKLGY